MGFNCPRKLFTAGTEQGPNRDDYNPGIAGQPGSDGHGPQRVMGSWSDEFMKHYSITPPRRGIFESYHFLVSQSHEECRVVSQRVEDFVGCSR